MIFTAVVLAAGSSSRFGRNKLLLPYGTSTVLQTIVDHLSVPGVDHVWVVTGPFEDDILRHVKGPSVRFVRNTAHEEGMSSSVRTAARMISEDVAGVIVAPGDMPMFTSSTVQILIEQYRPQHIVIPRYRTRRGHPILMDRRYFLESLDSSEDRILERILREHASGVQYVDVEDEGILRDFDTPEEYEQMMQDNVRQD